MATKYGLSIAMGTSDAVLWEGIIKQVSYIFLTILFRSQLIKAQKRGGHKNDQNKTWCSNSWA